MPERLVPESAVPANAAIYVPVEPNVMPESEMARFSDNPAIWQALFKVADAFDGYVFVHASPFRSRMLGHGA